MPGALKKISFFLGLRQSMVGLLGMVILVGIGEKMAERFLPIYLIALGGGALSIGLLNGLDNLLSALYSFPGGYLSDRLGFKRALLIFNLMAMSGFIDPSIFRSGLVTALSGTFPSSPLSGLTVASPPSAPGTPASLFKYFTSPLHADTARRQIMERIVLNRVLITSSPLESWNH